MSMMRMSRAGGPARVSVCVPAKDMVHAAFSFDLVKMFQHCALTGLDVMPHFCMGTLVVNQREDLAEMAVAAMSTHILWLDSDMMFPPDTLSRLLVHGEHIVAANYPTRQYPHKTVAYTKMNDWRSYLTHDGPDTGALIEVDAIGMGCMLVSMDVISGMRKPRFQTTWTDSSGDHMGEDFYFCSKAKEMGYRILVDDSLSRSVSHLGTIAFTHDIVRRGLD